MWKETMEEFDNIKLELEDWDEEDENEEDEVSILAFSLFLSGTLCTGLQVGKFFFFFTFSFKVDYPSKLHTKRK